MISADFVRALNITSEVTEIESRMILSKSRRMEYVEARMLLVKAMNEMGYHPMQIAPRMRISVNAVRALLDNFPIREKADKILSKMYIEIIKKLSEN